MHEKAIRKLLKSEYSILITQKYKKYFNKQYDIFLFEDLVIVIDKRNMPHQFYNNIEFCN